MIPAASNEPAARFGVRLLWGVEVPMRDGIMLSATLYMPANHSAPSPAICTLTPYISDHVHERVVRIAAAGLPFVVVDARGRGNSGGVFRPRIQEAKDGCDVVEWLARQPYCNGKVAMWGASYLGYAQWATAKEFPPHLATIVPTAAPYIGVDVPMRNNVFSPYLVQWLTLTSGRTSQRQIFADWPFWSTLFYEWHESGRPFRDLDSMCGNPSPIFQEYITHPEQDAYWDAYNPTPEQYERLQIPILTITGCYDGDQPGALEHYKQHMRSAGAAARACHYLIIGPWDHFGTSIPNAEFGGLTVGSAGVIDMLKLHLEWYRWTMEDGPRPAFLKKRVAYYLMGAERWRYADTLEDITERHEVYFLDSMNSADDVFSSGSLTPQSASGEPDQYTYDPRDSSLARVELGVDPQSLIDQRVVYASAGKQLVYHTSPFSCDTEVSGFFRLSVWMSIDQLDTDFIVSVYEIDENGGSLLLSMDWMRARYRAGLREARLIRTRQPLQYDFERFTFISRMVFKGKRLRLVIRPGDSIHFQRNHNSGGDVCDESRDQARVVTVRLFHDAAHPSALYVPIGYAESRDDWLTSPRTLSSQ